ncbi:Cyclic nucleotide-gated cation channel beta, putative [Pediculus humanus corporis]|uniref:Cyclic nucleotide-gated cation channel beta, putative n=1 Tax=Pediculus humanus subsp. corporis TaxID=121224 RepID=E0VVK1_PEDHC|nr:Cyclic nucleotide-gated cation channel beta, putative [Pediculus humanus corporis]EEB17407.1 Cyclic nucleotide-gated cation channel beta, putative [Pediculus humanus corporis]
MMCSISTFAGRCLLPFCNSKTKDDGKTGDYYDKSKVFYKRNNFNESMKSGFPNGEHETNKKQKNDRALDPQGKTYIIWLFVVTLAFLYNCWVIPLRSSFYYQTSENVNKWLAFDYACDVIYLLDLLFFKPRVMYLSDGFWIKDSKLTRIMYFHKVQFKMDVLSLIPLDLLCLKYGTDYLPIFRLPRFLKVQTFWEFYNRCDNVVASGYVVRVVRTLNYMLYLIHLNACAYYAFSVWEGLGTNAWVFNGKGNAYIRCFYFATKTATSIGKNPKPENVFEYMFMTWSWLMGVFVFALLIGQIRDIIATATRNRTEYKKLVDETLEYMRRLNLPMSLREKVKLWFKFTWEQQHTFNESNILDTLPPKLKTDVAINVHIQALNKVQIFHDCDPALLRELVLKLQSVLFLPGDYICRKGEVGKEMYIVKTGIVEVLGEDDNEVIATLKEGSVFGEISLLSLGAGNRRTASVRSGGFSNLFILNKYDLNEALVYYPDAQEILKNKAKMKEKSLATQDIDERKKLIKENEERERQNRLKEQSEQSDDVSDDTEDSSGSDDCKKESKKIEKIKNESKLNQLISTSAWLTTVTSVAIPEPILNKLSLNTDDVIKKKITVKDSKDTIQCDVTVHNEMNCK